MTDYLAYIRALVARVWFVAKAIMPRWLLAALTICLIIPGPFDELAMALVAGVIAAIRYRATVAAWREYIA